MSTLSFLIGLNNQVVGKTDPQKLSYAGAFTPTKVSITELGQHIGKGHPWMPAVLDQGAKRWQAKANYAELLAVDIDGGLNIQEALSHPFISQYAALGIESASSSDELHKFRVVFALPAAVNGWESIRVCNQYLIHLLKVADPACKDASRFFFGAPGRLPFLLNESAKLPDSFITDAVAWHESVEAEQARLYREAMERRALYQSEDRNQYELVKSALSFIPQRQPGGGNYQECINVLMALNNEFGEADAIALGEWWSPSIKGNDWQIEKKIRSFRRGAARPIGIGTLFHIAKGYGFRFPESTPEAREAQRRRDGKITFERDESREAERDERDRLRAVDLGPQISREEWQAKQLKNKAIALFESAKNRVSKIAIFKGFGVPPVERVASQQIVSSHAEGYLEGVRRGARLIVNRSHPGSGKDFFTSRTTPEFWGTGRVIAVQPDALNPSDQQYLEWALLEGRHLGTISDDGKLRRASHDTLDTEKVQDANCIHAAGIALAASKNPILPIYKLACQGCKHNYHCGKESGDGYGARFQANQVWANNRIRTNYGRMPHAEGDEGNNLQQSTLILDEASSNLEVGRNIKIALTDFQIKHSQIALEDETEALALKPFFKWLLEEQYRTLDGFDAHHGAGFHVLLPELQRLIPEQVGGMPIADWLALLEDEAPELRIFGLEKKENSLTKTERGRLARLRGKKFNESIAAEMDQLGHRKATKEERHRLSLYRQSFRSFNEEKEFQALNQRHEATKWKPRDPKETLAMAKDLPLRWLADFVAVAKGEIPGYIQVSRFGEFTLTLLNTHHKDALLAARRVVVNDASETGDIAALSIKYGIPENEIFVFELAVPKHGNLEVVQVTGLGKMGRNRGAGLEQCRQSLVAEFKKQDPTHKTFDWKNFSPDGVLFRDSIGSNNFIGCQSISATLPRPNLGAVLAEYCLLTGRVVGLEDSQFQEYYRAKLAQGLIQLKERLRSIQRPDEKLTCYLLGDDDIPIAVDRMVPAHEICRDAARKGDRSFLWICDIAKDLLEKGIEINQSLIARISREQGVNDGKGLSRSYVNKLWDRVTLFLGELYKKSDRAKIPIPDDEKSAGIIALVESLAADFEYFHLIEVWAELVSPRELAQIWHSLSLNAQKQLLRSMLLWRSDALEVMP